MQEINLRDIALLEGEFSKSGNILKSGRGIPAFLSSESGYFSEQKKIFTPFDKKKIL